MFSWNPSLVQIGMFKQYVREGYLRSPRRPLQNARSLLGDIELLREQTPEAWPTRTALPESLSELAKLLHEFGWDDLAALARCEEVTVYRNLEEDRPGVFAGEINLAMDDLRDCLRRDEQYENALEVNKELMRLPSVGAEAKKSARYWRVHLLVKLGRDEAVEAAAELVAATRARSQGRKGISESRSLESALLEYAQRLMDVGRGAEAVKAIAEAVMWRKKRGESLSRLLQPVDALSHVLVRLGRREEAGTCIIELLGEGLEREPIYESPDTWYRLSARLLELGLLDAALETGQEAVKAYRDSAYWARKHLRETLRDEYWYDTRASGEVAYQRRREELDSARDNTVKAGVDLNDGLLNLSAVLRELGRLDEAAAAEAEAGEVSAAAARLAAKALPYPDSDEWHDEDWEEYAGDDAGDDDDEDL